jgi:hypothetical protein
MFAVCTPPRHNIYDVRKVASVDQAVIDLVEGVSIWGVPDLEVDSFVHEVRTFDHHLSTCYSHAGCACLSLADVRFPGQLLCSRLPSPTSRHDLGRLYMPAPAVHKIDPWPPLLSHLLVHVC